MLCRAATFRARAGVREAIATGLKPAWRYATRWQSAMMNPAPMQPIPYSHKKHLALGMECKACHTNPQPGKLMTFPDTARCMQCHAAVAKDKPSIQKLASYARSKQAVPWVRVYTVLPGVAWSHRPHLQAGVNCETCHGQVRGMEQMSEITSVTTMYVCLNCHEMNHAKTACDTCHKS